MFCTSIYAHTRDARPESEWEPLYHSELGHSERVAALCSSFCAHLQTEQRDTWAEVGRLLGLFHDMGKADEAFQAYLKDSHAGRATRAVDHKSAAAHWAQGQESPLRYFLPYVFHGHHSGLPDGCALRGKLSSSRLDDDLLHAMPAHYQQLACPARVRVMGAAQSEREGIVAASFLIRMLHSCLIDADWLATEAFCDPTHAQARTASSFDSIEILSERLEASLCAKEAQSVGRINQLRREIHHASYESASLPQGVYRLNVPTGGGKTLASLSFALRHAQRHQLSRIIYVIPYTSIIEQTAQEFRRILGDDQVVEHHSNLAEIHDSEKNRFASENWDAPIIVTTNVQFFESLYSHKNKSCRKLHNIARSVVIFDEAQSLPCDYLAPCLAAMKCLQRDFGASLVLCTATQPALANRPEDDFHIGWEPSEMRSLLGEELEQRLYTEMKRVDIEMIGQQSQEELIEHFSHTAQHSALFIVNLTRQAQDLYQRIASRYPSASVFHLSARMCPAHRSAQLEQIRQRLSEGLPTILIATRVVEAGVDISFPIVYRDSCGLDSLAQSAGRCNRHGELEMGKTYAFQAREDEYRLPATFVDAIAGQTALQAVMATMEGHDLLDAAMVEHYFRHFYARRAESCPGWDSHNIIELIGSQVSSIESIPYPKIGDAFKLIPDGQYSLMMPYSAESEQLRAELLHLQRLGQLPRRSHYRQVASYSVNIYERELELLQPFCECLHAEAGIYMLTNPDRYDAVCGLTRQQKDLNYIY